MPNSAGALPLSRALVGTWELVSREDRAPDGAVHPDPALGADPIALLFYDRSGHFAAQFMKRDRAGLLGELVDGAVGARNNTRARGGYDAYFGTYSVDDAHGVVAQRLVGALSPENVGHEVSRPMAVAADVLTIRLDTTAVDGTAVERILVWRRVD